MARTFDETELLERVDSDISFLAETVQMLASDGRALMAELRAALSAGDASGVGRLGHALKGMISNFCAPETQNPALMVEQIGKSRSLDDAPMSTQRLEQNLESLIAELEQFVQTRS